MSIKINKISTGIILSMALCSGVAYAGDYFDPTPRSGVQSVVNNPAPAPLNQSNGRLSSVAAQSPTLKDHKPDFVQRYQVSSAS